ASYVGVPLVARGRVVGCLSLALAAAGTRRYGPDDLALAQDLGQRVALALDRARLFEAQRHIAMTLQASLLPPRLPEVPGSERAGRPGTLIGFLPSPELPEKVNELKVGDVALFFTDGLTDVRGPSGTFGEERLAALLQRCEGLGAEEIASTLEEAVVAFQAGEPRDDLAMLVPRVVGPVP